MANTFSINGTPCSNYGIFVEQYPIEEGGERIVEQVQIPGRTGALTIDTGAMANATRVYHCMCKGTPADARAIKTWLLGQAELGVITLTDTYDSGVTRKATLLKVPDIKNYRGKHFQFDLEFSVDPRRFTGQQWDHSLTIVNPGMTAKPTISIWYDEDFDFEQHSFVDIQGPDTQHDFWEIEISRDMFQSGVVVNSDLMSIRTYSEGQLATVSLPEGFPLFKKGTTRITCTNCVIMAIDLGFWEP